MEDTTYNDLSTELEIWFKRWFSMCRNCGTLLTEQNAYSRSNTYSHLHNYCKTCYIEIQKIRNSGYVKSEPLFSLITNKRLVVFASIEEKRTYQRERSSLAKFGRSCDEYSSIVGCTENWNRDNHLLCDQCGGLLKYDEKGDLVCTVCYLIYDTLPVNIERNTNFKKSLNSHKLSSMENAFWSDDMKMSSDESGEGCFDFFYSRHYSKKRRV